MAISWTDVTDHASEMSAVSVNARARILGFAEEAFDPEDFGGEDSFEYQLVRINLAAHIGTLDLRKGKGGPITSQTAAQLSRSYGAMMSDDVLGTTSYGQMLKFFMARSPSRGPVVI